MEVIIINNYLDNVVRKAYRNPDSDDDDIDE